MNNAQIENLSKLNSQFKKMKNYINIQESQDMKEVNDNNEDEDFQENNQETMNQDEIDFE